MNKILHVLRFGLPYLRRYWVRLAAGVLLGVLFGLSNASFVWAAKTISGRMVPEKPAPEESQQIKAGDERFIFTNTVGTVTNNLSQQNGAANKQFTDRLKAWLDQKTREWVDPWLPRADRDVDWRQVLGGILFFPGLVALRGIMGYLSAYCMAWVGEKVVNDLRTDVLIKLNGLSIDYFNRAKMGDMITHVNGDTATLLRCLRVGCADLIKEPMTFIFTLSALFWLDWRLTLGALVLFPVFVVPVFVLGKRARRASKVGTQVGVTQASLLVEILSAIRVVKAFGLEQMQVDRFRKYSQQIVRQNMKGVRAKELINPIIETVAMVGLGLLVVYIAYQHRPLENMAAFLLGLVFLYTPVKRLAAIHVMFEQTAVGVERLMRILREQPSVKDPPISKPLREFKSEIAVDNVSFAYGSDPVLSRVRLRIPRGCKLGVAGESGSGKSTLMNLVFRFFDPTEGCIRIDGIDFRELPGAELRKQMALVSQEVVLFDMTVAENIALGKPGGATREEIEAAARAAFAHEFIVRMPHGYDSNVGERGVTLSVGQRQRISIARAFIRNAPILVLDEATASLDSQAEGEVQAAIDRLAESRTVICVAHRLSTLARMDQIIVLSRGQIIEQGSFSDLLQQGGTFADMARRQGIAYAEWSAGK